MRLTTSIDPVLRGRLGSAWLLDMDAIGRARGMEDDPRKAVSLPSWIASAAYAHPMWSHYWIFGVALREAPGVPPPVIHLAGATHEVLVVALDPKYPPAIDVFPRFLTPFNFAGQFIASSDDDAAARIRQAVQDVIDGTLNPDTDFRRLWVQRFSGSNLKPQAAELDFIAGGPGGLVVSGMGAQNVRNLQTIVETSATLRADESKPQ